MFCGERASFLESLNFVGEDVVNLQFRQLRAS